MSSPEDRRATLHRAWTRCFVEPTPASEQVFDELLRRYAEPHRHYHTLEHLAEVLQTVQQLLDAPPATVLLAAFYHDAIYDTRSSENEAHSAELAQRNLGKLGVLQKDCDEVARLIRLTQSHETTADDLTGQVLLDADLAILAAPLAKYQAYAEAIRREYAWLSEPDYRAGRRAVLQRFLSRARLYHTAAMQLLEPQARTNLLGEWHALA